MKTPILVDITVYYESSMAAQVVRAFAWLAIGLAMQEIMFLLLTFCLANVIRGLEG